MACQTLSPKFRRGNAFTPLPKAAQSICGCGARCVYSSPSPPKRQQTLDRAFTLTEDTKNQSDVGHRVCRATPIYNRQLPPSLHSLAPAEGVTGERRVDTDRSGFEARERPSRVTILGKGVRGESGNVTPAKVVQTLRACSVNTTPWLTAQVKYCSRKSRHITRDTWQIPMPNQLFV
ncbi:hypothetical protein CBL_10708 [Carabus blaptoides fortunei]